MATIRKYLAARLRTLAARRDPQPAVVGRVAHYTSSPPVMLDGCGCGASAQGGLRHSTGCAAYRRGDTVGP